MTTHMHVIFKVCSLDYSEEMIQGYIHTKLVMQ